MAQNDKNYWDNLEKPWNRTDCEAFYTTSRNRYSNRQMAARTGRCLQTMERWREEDEWDRKREFFQQQLTKAIQSRSIEATSKRFVKDIERCSVVLAEQLAAIAFDNYEAHKLERDLAIRMLTSYRDLLDKAEEEFDTSTLEGQITKLKAMPGFDANQWSLILTRSTQGIANATGLINYIQLDAAIKTLIAKGYEIVDPSQEVIDVTSND